MVALLSRVAQQPPWKLQTSQYDASGSPQALVLPEESHVISTHS